MPEAHRYIYDEVDNIIKVSTSRNDPAKLVSHKKKKKKENCTKCACTYIIIIHHNLGNTGKQNKIHRF